MSVNKEFDKLVESILEHGPPYDETERLLLAVFGPSNPEWEGYAIPKLEVFKKYLRAREVSEILFGNSPRFEIMNFEPEPFKDYCGMAVQVRAEDLRAVSAGFQDEVSVKLIRELADLVDSFSIDAELLLKTNEPRLCLSWYINDPFIRNTDKGQ